MNNKARQLLDEIGEIGDRLKLDDPGWYRTWENAQSNAYMSNIPALERQLSRLQRKHWNRLAEQYRAFYG